MKTLHEESTTMYTLRLRWSKPCNFDLSFRTLQFVVDHDGLRRGRSHKPPSNQTHQQQRFCCYMKYISSFQNEISILFIVVLSFSNLLKITTSKTVMLHSSFLSIVACMVYNNTQHAIRKGFHFARNPFNVVFCLLSFGYLRIAGL